MALKSKRPPKAKGIELEIDGVKLPLSVPAQISVTDDGKRIADIIVGKSEVLVFIEREESPIKIRY